MKFIGVLYFFRIPLSTPKILFYFGGAVVGGSVFFLREKKTLAWSHFFAFFSLFSRKETVFTHDLIQNFHVRKQVSRTLSNNFFTHCLKFFTEGKLIIFTERLLFSRMIFLEFFQFKHCNPWVFNLKFPRVKNRFLGFRKIFP